MNKNTEKAARFHIRCCLRRGRSKSQAYNQLTRAFGYGPDIGALIDDEYEKAKGDVA